MRYYVILRQWELQLRQYLQFLPQHEEEHKEISGSDMNDGLLTVWSSISKPISINNYQIDRPSAIYKVLMSELAHIDNQLISL